jgi:hypothetical protein
MEFLVYTAQPAADAVVLPALKPDPHTTHLHATVQRSLNACTEKGPTHGAQRLPSKHCLYLQAKVLLALAAARHKHTEQTIQLQEPKPSEQFSCRSTTLPPTLPSHPQPTPLAIPPAHEVLVDSTPSLLLRRHTYSCAAAASSCAGSGITQPTAVSASGTHRHSHTAYSC